ncbi:class I SAM-dependent methyltransferase [Hyperthermus butylicus]|uniref:Methyl transferase n=1 Tax=Hyperthermus butylicus (strain DSM 5456 / JCM 9403 / PLM1-5) TaxID=415426 RepID=A2BIU5_HYPBU|nr:methyltransferase domain-containing protein [Hyperthermus butylicus]ABM79901.1 methyl transferase [Hyperthermus butylicus DSM 5456]
MNGTRHEWGFVEIYEYRPRRLVIPGFLLSKLKTACRKDSSNSIVFARRTQYYEYSVEILCSRDEVNITINGEHVFSLAPSSLPSRIRDDVIYFFDEHNNRLLPVEVRSNEGYMRLYFTAELDAPTLLINGIHMHRIVGVRGPLHDSQLKVSRLGVRRGDRVLDTCTGLGYTTIIASSRGATVYTIEVSEYVLSIASLNPASWLLANENVRIVHADATIAVELLPDEYFDKILHDPPRFNMAGELYSLEFYQQLYRVLKPGGKLYHYTGVPLQARSRRLSPIVRGVIERLRRAGFERVWFDKQTQGVIAVKPR